MILDSNYCSMKGGEEEQLIRVDRLSEKIAADGRSTATMGERKRYVDAENRLNGLKYATTSGHFLPSRVREILSPLNSGILSAFCCPRIVLVMKGMRQITRGSCLPFLAPVIFFDFLLLTGKSPFHIIVLS